MREKGCVKRERRNAENRDEDIEIESEGCG